jgi:hypothetical protein
MAMRVFWPGATAQQVADQVTDKLEKTLQEVPYADKIRSYSKPGEALIIFQVKDNSPPREMQQIWYTVRKKVGDMRATLPAGVIGPFFNDEFGDVYGSIYALSADGFTYQELKEQADRVRQRLLKVKDVNKVQVFGAQDEKVFIEISQKRLAQLGLDFNLVLAQIGQQNAVESAGTINSPTDYLQVRVGGQFNTLDELKVFPIRANGASFKLGDIAQIRRAYVDPPQVKVRHQGREVIALGISMAKGGDIIELGQALHAAGPDHPRRPAGGHRTAPVPGPVHRGLALGRRIRPGVDRGGGDRAGRELHQPGAALQAFPHRLASGSGGGHHHPAGAGHHLRGHVLLGRGLAQDLARLADHRAGPAGGRRHHCRRDDGAQAGGGLRQGARGHLRLRGHGDAHAHRHADHRGRLPADRHGQVDGGRVHLRDLRRHGGGVADLVAGVGVLRALPRHADPQAQGQRKRGRRAARAVRHAVLHTLSRAGELVRQAPLDHHRPDHRHAGARAHGHGQGAEPVLP